MPSVSWSRDLRRQEDRDARLAAEAEASLANVTAKLNSWASDRVGMLSAASPRHRSSNGDEKSTSIGGRRDDVLWMKSILSRDGDAVGNDDEDEIMETLDGSIDTRSRRSFSFPTTPVATREHGDGAPYSGALERADTPVMSNSKGAIADGEDENTTTNIVMNRYSSLRKKKSIHSNDKTPSPNIHTPAPSNSTPFVNQQTPTPLPNKRVPLSSPHQQFLSLEDRFEVQTCHRYHDVLHRYLKSRRSWAERQDLAVSSGALEPQDTSSLLSTENTRIQVDFLQSLATLCYEDNAVAATKSGGGNSASSSPSREGNFWNLLAHLRRLGMDALLWREDSPGQQMVFVEHMIQKQYQSGNITPLEILESLRVNQQQQQATSLIQRRYELLSWLEDCFYRQLPYQIKAPKTINEEGINNTEYKRDSALFSAQGLVETDKDAALLSQSLALVLAGRLPQAKDLMRSNGLSWRAVVWGGGSPFGYETTASQDSTGPPKRLPTGNPNRALWQTMLWRLVEESNHSTNEEKAVASLLCNNLKASFDNPALRSWEKALYAGLKAIVGRSEDVLLYQHINSKFAQSRLEATADMEDMNETNLINTIASTPYPEMLQGDDLFATVTAGFVIGQTAVKVLLKDMEQNMAQSSGCDYNVMLRFVTHLLLYLDSTVEDPHCRAVTGPLQWDLHQIRNRVLVDYIRSLSDREMWNLIVLYACMLPHELMLEHLPPLLLPVTHINDRRTIVTQLREIEPQSELQVLRVVVQQLQVLLIQQQNEDSLQNRAVEEDMDRETSDLGDGDEAMMKAIMWFCILDDHAQEALAYSNSVIRQFLRCGKLEPVVYFVDRIRPKNILEKLEKDDDVEDERMPEHGASRDRNNIISEHNAYESYMQAERVVTDWHECMEKAHGVESPVSPSFLHSMVEWNDVERAIAVSSERRQLIEEQKDLATRVIHAAEDAREALLDVLKYEGGWLWPGALDEDDVTFAGPTGDALKGHVESKTREIKAEWDDLRKQVLPHVVMLHGQVCQETAEFMAKGLHHLVSSFSLLSPEQNTENTLGAGLGLLDPSASLSTSSVGAVNSCKFSPTYWTTKAMDLADILSSDTYNIPVHEPALNHMAKLTVEHLQYCADFEHNPSL